MRPVSPVVPGMELPETKFAENQPEYNTLPAFRDHKGIVLSRWRLTWKERLRALFVGDVYLMLHTFNMPPQPVSLQIERPSFDYPDADSA